MLVDTLVLLPVGGVVIAMILPESSTNSLLGPYVVCTIGTRRLATDPAVLCVGFLPIHGGGAELLVSSFPWIVVAVWVALHPTLHKGKSA